MPSPDASQPAKAVGCSWRAADGLWALDTLTGAQTLLAQPPYDPARQRFNDGKVDPAGRFWVGSISDAREPEAAL